MDVVPVAARRVAWRRLIAGLTLTFAWARPLAGAEVTRARCVHPPVFRAHRGTVDRAALGLEILGYAQFHRGSVVVGFNARHLRGHNLYPSHHLSARAHDFPLSYDEFFGLEWRASLDGAAALAPVAGAEKDEGKSTIVLEFAAPNATAPQSMDLVARHKGEVVVAWDGVEICPESPASPAGSVDLAVCTMVLVGGRDNAQVEVRVASILTWVAWHAFQGAQHALVYLDTALDGTHTPSEIEAEFANDLEEGLKDTGADINVVLVDWRFRDKNFATQILMQSHCLRSYRDYAKWLLNTDIDELVQPRGAAMRVIDVTRALLTQPDGPSAALIPMRFMVLPHVAPAPVFDMGQYRLAGPEQPHGAGAKVLMRPEDVGFFGVHIASNVRTFVKLLNASTLVVNHFKGFGTMAMGTTSVEDPTWPAAWATFQVAAKQRGAAALDHTPAAAQRMIYVMPTGGRLGNDLSTYAACYALALRTNLSLAVPRRNGACEHLRQLPGCGAGTLVDEALATRLPEEQSWWDSNVAATVAKIVAMPAGPFSCSGYRQSARYFANDNGLAAAVHAVMARVILVSFSLFVSVEWYICMSTSHRDQIPGCLEDR